MESSQNTTQHAETRAGAAPCSGLIIQSQADFVRALRQRRRELGLTCLELDHRAGFHDGYTSHLEHPERRTGRGSLRLTAMATVWLQTLGLDLVLVRRGSGSGACVNARTAQQCFETEVDEERNCDLGRMWRPDRGPLK
jgi:hypothetical protein